MLFNAKFGNPDVRTVNKSGEVAESGLINSQSRLTAVVKNPRFPIGANG